MANRERGEVELVADGKIYILRLSINAVAEIENYLDIGVNDIIAMLQKPGDFRVGRWRVMLWGALREFHPCSIEEAGEIMGIVGVDAAIDSLTAAMQAAFPDADKAASKNPPRASRKVGKRS